MKFQYNKKYFTIAVYSVITFAVIFAIIACVFKYNEISKILKSLFSVLSPILWGFALAYLLNPMMKFFENLIKKPIEKKKKHPKLVRALSVTVTSLLTLAIIASLIAIVLPQIVSSIISIINNTNNYFTTLEKWVDKFLSDNVNIYNYINSQFEDIKKYAIEIGNKLQPQLSALISNLTAGAFGFLIGIKDFIIGFIIMIYLLLSKESFIAQFKKVMFAIFPIKFCKSALTIGRRADYTFIHFISGKAVDSIIIGILCFIAMAIMNMPYALLISFIIGITNMIPFFGPFIGAIPSAILVLMDEPSKVLAFIIFIIILQQFDGNILGPKILGNSTGLPAFWVMFAILVGGGCFGFIGMLLGVPVFAVIYAIIRESIEAKLKKKNLPISTLTYMDKTKITEILDKSENHEGDKK